MVTVTSGGYLEGSNEAGLRTSHSGLWATEEKYANGKNSSISNHLPSSDICKVQLGHWFSVSQATHPTLDRWGQVGTELAAKLQVEGTKIFMREQGHGITGVSQQMEN
ncbi:hypothetical protein Q8A73_015906 [Channa argus]|nr:hypothetical protein Q8A73_015906 [Channa argus]